MISCILYSLFVFSVSGQGIFNVVRFPNTACGSANNFNGTCYTASECNALGGSSSGSCASGFGVCCVFSLSCGGRTNANTSYATVSSFSTTSDRDPCTYTYCRCSEDVCKLREVKRWKGKCSNDFKISNFFFKFSFLLQQLPSELILRRWWSRILSQRSLLLLLIIWSLQRALL